MKQKLAAAKHPAFLGHQRKVDMNLSPFFVA